MTRSTRSTAGVNHGLLDEDETEEHGQEGNEKVSDMDVSQAIENALKICKFGRICCSEGLNRLVTIFSYFFVDLSYASSSAMAINHITSFGSDDPECSERNHQRKFSLWISR